MPGSTTGLTPKQQQQSQRMMMLGMIVWFLHLNLLNALTSVACKWHWLTMTIAGMETLQFVDILISAIALLIMAYMIYVPWRNWRSLQREKPLRNPHMLRDTEEDRGALLSFVAMMANSFFFLFVIATFVPMLALVACGQT